MLLSEIVPKEEHNGFYFLQQFFFFQLATFISVARQVGEGAVKAWDHTVISMTFKFCFKLAHSFF